MPEERGMEMDEYITKKQVIEWFRCYAHEDRPIRFEDLEFDIQHMIPEYVAPEQVMVECNVYDQEQIYRDCTVQVLTNTATGAVSVGWWQNDKEDV